MLTTFEISWQLIASFHNKNMSKNKKKKMRWKNIAIQIKF